MPSEVYQSQRLCQRIEWLAVPEAAAIPDKPDWGVLKILGVVLLILGLPAVLLTLQPPMHGPTKHLKNYMRARDIAMICRIHAGEHGGNFPSSLAALDPPIEQQVSARWQYFDYDSDRPYDWLYFPGAKTADGEKRVVVASPTASTKRAAATSERIVAFADGHAEWWPESDFQAFLRQLAVEQK
jgi:hypothetical protein